MNLKDKEKLKRLTELLTMIVEKTTTSGMPVDISPRYMGMFSRFPQDLSKALNKAITPEDNDMHEALLCACTWLAETEQKLEKAGDKINLLQKQKTTHDAQLSGQRDRMNVMTNQIDILYKNMDQVLDKLAKMDERINHQTGAIVQFENIAVETADKVSKLGIKLADQENTADIRGRQTISQSKASVELKDRVDIHSQNFVGIRNRILELEKVFVSAPSTQKEQL